MSYHLKTPWRDGTTHVEFEPVELLARLAALVPPPRDDLGAAAQACFRDRYRNVPALRRPVRILEHLDKRGSLPQAYYRPATRGPPARASVVSAA